MLSTRNDRILLSPLSSSANAFINNFTGCLVQEGFQVGEFRWKVFPTGRTVIFHWPNEFFIDGGFLNLLGCTLKIAIMRFYSAIFGVHFIWVAHNIQPHDTKKPSLKIRNAFLSSLDGVIFLSKFSRDTVGSMGILPKNIRILQTVHGDYRPSMTSPPREKPLFDTKVRLVTFGQIRPYKNIETLITTILGMQSSALLLTIIGYGQDDELVRKIKTLSANSPAINLDIRSEFVPEADLEKSIDGSHGVILPYRNILNSGSVFFALSRNRPVLAPRTGSLPEVAELVGSDWLTLYDSEIDDTAIQTFIANVGIVNNSSTCDLSSFSWERVGRDLSQFITGTRGSRAQWRSVFWAR